MEDEENVYTKFILNLFRKLVSKYVIFIDLLFKITSCVNKVV